MLASGRPWNGFLKRVVRYLSDFASLEFQPVRTNERWHVGSELMADDTGLLTEAAVERGAADADCVSRALAGDLRAFDELVERYQRRVVGVAYRVLGNSADAADVCQDAMLRAFRSLSSLSEPARFGAWLTRIACNLALNFRRDRRPALSLASEEIQGAAENPATAGQSVRRAGDPMLTEETKAAIDSAIERLPEKQRLSLILFALEGMPHKEVAVILECIVDAVKWNVFQARKRLKDELAEYLME
ncbi:MAG: sigma-70 family RNA polymerase sigma factor [Phycisphaerae bacterium]